MEAKDYNPIGYVNKHNRSYIPVDLLKENELGEILKNEYRPVYIHPSNIDEVKNAIRNLIKEAHDIHDF